MPHEPVQVVTNPEQLRQPRETNPPGSAGTDFFEGNDAGFAAHRESLAHALASIRATIASDAWLGAYGGLGYVRVMMTPRAIAKTHRPQKSLFKPNWTPHVATEGIGEPIYAVTPQSLDEVIRAVQAAPDSVTLRMNPRKGVEEPNPPRSRCEVSAIESVALWSEADRRDFTAAEAAAWLARSGVGHNYLVSLFPFASASRTPALALAQRSSARALQSDLEQLHVEAIGRGSSTPGANRTLTLRVLASDAPTKVELGMISSGVGAALLPTGRPSNDATVHESVLTVLSRNPLVRSIELPPVVQPSEATPEPVGELPVDVLPERIPGNGAHGIVGVIDGGVGAALDDWVEDRWDQLDPSDVDAEHGNFISGLLVAGGRLNPTYLSEQRDGCRVVDIAVLPTDPARTGQPFESYYPGGVPDFMDEVEAAVRHFREHLGVRIFNFSMNFDAPGNQSRYGYTARRLDEIARTFDVIFVVSAGNINAPADRRPEWDANPANAVAALARETRGIISEPAESLFNISVSALNPPGLSGQVDYALTSYSRRGPGLRGATKPDFAHVGGSGRSDLQSGTGLRSLDRAGALVTNAGTSFAAPLVARQLADLDHLIEGDVSREVLLGLLAHYSALPASMSNRVVLPVARDLVGHGKPLTAEQMLQRPDSEITLVFNSVVLPGEQHSLIFGWPASLVSNGKCRGHARLTLVARPVLAYEHGDERVRVNIDAKLMQEQSNGGFAGALKAANQPATAGVPLTERDLIKEALKWQVVKSFDATFRGRGESSQWKFQVEYLTRADEQLPTAGVEFAAVLTIADPTGTAPVFQEVRQELSALNIRTADIRTSVQTRVQPRA